MKTPYYKLIKIYTKCYSCMTKMAGIYGKTPLKYSSTEPENRLPWDYVYNIWDVGPTNVVQMMILGQNCFLIHLNWKILKVDF